MSGRRQLLAPASMTDADPASRFSVKIADRADEVEQALRLRYQVFAEEEDILPMRNVEGIERDEFDDYCDHLIVRDEECGLVVGVYRLLPGSRAPNGRIYTATEFDLARFTEEIPRALEIGRTCVHRDYRDQPTLLLLWNGMLGYYDRGGYDYLMGCASVRAQDVRVVSKLHSYFRDQRYGVRRYGIVPRPELRIEALEYLDGVTEQDAFALLPAMIKGYLRLGSEVVHEPVFDPIFRTYDFCMILSKDRVTPRYRRRFLAQPQP